MHSYFCSCYSIKLLDPAREVIQFILYSRSYCHLCDDMLHAIEGLRGQHVFTVEVIDVDADEALVAQYDELVPVLLGKKVDAQPVRLCHYFLDEKRVRSFLEEEI